MESTAHDHTKRTAESARNTAARTFERMTTEPVAGLIVRLGIPTVLSMLVTALYNTVSTFYVSYLGTSAVGAMGVAFALQMVIQALGIMVGQGCASQTSRLLGAKEYAKAHETASSALFTSLLLGVLFSVVSLYTLTSLLSVMGATDTILPYAIAYAKPVLYAAPFMAASFTLNNILRSEGMAFVGMIGLGIGGILNMAVAPLFIFTFDLGISGAGWATALSQTVSFAILLSFFAGGRTRRKRYQPSAQAMLSPALSRRTEPQATVSPLPKASACPGPNCTSSGSAMPSRHSSVRAPGTGVTPRIRASTSASERVQSTWPSSLKTLAA